MNAVSRTSAHPLAEKSSQRGLVRVQAGPRPIKVPTNEIEGMDAATLLVSQIANRVVEERRHQFSNLSTITDYKIIKPDEVEAVVDRYRGHFGIDKLESVNKMTQATFVDFSELVKDDEISRYGTALMQSDSIRELGNDPENLHTLESKLMEHMALKHIGSAFQPSETIDWALARLVIGVNSPWRHLSRAVSIG
jgi:hypothetical protein